MTKRELLIRDLLEFFPYIEQRDGRVGSIYLNPREIEVLGTSGDDVWDVIGERQLRELGYRGVIYGATVFENANILPGYTYVLPDGITHPVGIEPKTGMPLSLEYRGVEKAEDDPNNPRLSDEPDEPTTKQVAALIIAQGDGEVCKRILRGDDFRFSALPDGEVRPIFTEKKFDG